MAKKRFKLDLRTKLQCRSHNCKFSVQLIEFFQINIFSKIFGCFSMGNKVFLNISALKKNIAINPIRMNFKEASLVSFQFENRRRFQFQRSYYPILAFMMLFPFCLNYIYCSTNPCLFEYRKVSVEFHFMQKWFQLKCLFIYLLIHGCVNITDTCDNYIQAPITKFHLIS